MCGPSLNLELPVSRKLADIGVNREMTRTSRKSAKLDIRYIETWSLPLDFYIIFKTILQVIKPPKTAY